VWVGFSIIRHELGLSLYNDDNNVEGMMSNTVELDAALKLALHLRPAERLRLVELVVASVSQEIAEDRPSAQIANEEPWGKRLVRLINELDPIDFVDPEIEDPVEWVQAQRRKDESRLDDYWSGKK
jgi:hypothetical protein